MKTISIDYNSIERLLNALLKLSINPNDVLIDTCEVKSKDKEK